MPFLWVKRAPLSFSLYRSIEDLCLLLAKLHCVNRTILSIGLVSQPGTSVTMYTKEDSALCEKSPRLQQGELGDLPVLAK